MRLTYSVNKDELSEQHNRAQGLQLLLRCAQRGPGPLRQEGTHSEKCSLSPTCVLTLHVFSPYAKKALILKSALIAKILKSELLQCPSMVNTLGLLGPLQ